MTSRASSVSRTPIRSVASGSAAGVLATHPVVMNDVYNVTTRQTGAVAVEIRLHDVFQSLRTAPSLEATLPTVSAHSLQNRSAGARGDAICAAQVAARR